MCETKACRNIKIDMVSRVSKDLNSEDSSMTSNTKSNDSNQPGEFSQGKDQKSMKVPTFLFVFDFDHTIIDVNSDIFIQNSFHTKPIPEHLKIVAREQGWTSYMQEVFRFHYSNNVSRKQYCDVLETLPFVPAIPKSFDCLRKLGAELIIISDANTFFIRHILQHHRLLHHFHQIYSNPSYFDSSGQLVINPYHANLECKLSSRNLCKGRVLMEYVRQRSEEGQTFRFIGYAGDGVNDFCPMARLHSGDLACPKRDYAICDFIDRKKVEDGVTLRARLVYWSNGDDITSGVTQKLQELRLMPQTQI